MDVSAALLEQLEALAMDFFSSARPAAAAGAAASRVPLDNRQRYGAVLVPGAECTRRREEIQKEILLAGTVRQACKHNRSSF